MTRPCYEDFCLTMGRRGRPREGVYGVFIDPTKPGAIDYACRLTRGEAAHSRATHYRYFDLGFAQTLPTEVGSVQPSGGSLENSSKNCWSAHPDWVDYDRFECRSVTHAMSVSASVDS